MSRPFRADGPNRTARWISGRGSATRGVSRSHSYTNTAFTACMHGFSGSRSGRANACPILPIHDEHERLRFEDEDSRHWSDREGRQQACQATRRAGRRSSCPRTRSGTRRRSRRSWHRAREGRPARRRLPRDCGARHGFGGSLCRLFPWRDPRRGPRRERPRHAKPRNCRSCRIREAVRLHEHGGRFMVRKGVGSRARTSRAIQPWRIRRASSLPNASFSRSRASTSACFGCRSSTATAIRTSRRPSP